MPSKCQEYRIRPPKVQHWVCLGFNPIRFRLSRKNLALFDQLRRRQLKKRKHWKRKDFILYFNNISKFYIQRESQRIIRCNSFVSFNNSFIHLEYDKKRNVSKRDTITKFITIKKVLSYFLLKNHSVSIKFCSKYFFFTSYFSEILNRTHNMLFQYIAIISSFKYIRLINSSIFQH